MSKAMSVKEDLKCTFNMPEKLSSEFNGHEEEYHDLPPYAPVAAYPVDEYEACPTNWMHGSDVVSSYFVGVKEDHGMWLDFNDCFYNTHDIAVVISVQGINPITGQKMVAEKALKLEQYHKKCPIHNTKFKQDRYCEKCGFKWPGQNYLATTGTPETMLWLDGFRTPEGKVRQYIFTEDKMRGVASQLIGEERVFAIGIAYYLSKEKKLYNLKRPAQRVSSVSYSQPMHFTPYHLDLRCDGFSGSSAMDCGSPVADMLDLDMGKITSQVDLTNNSSSSEQPICGNLNKTKGKIQTQRFGAGGMLRGSAQTSSKKSVKPITPVKKLEIGAGALIKQRVFDDPKMMDYWESEPAGMIYINYCDEETQKKILDAGKRADKKDGFMKDIKVG